MKVIIPEEKLLNLRNMASESNVSHKPFVKKDVPLAEKDKYEIGSEGGNNDFFHVTEVNQEDIDFILKFKPNEYVRWAVYYKPGIIPEYFEKKKYAIECKKLYMHLFGRGEIIDLYRYQNINESYNSIMNTDLSNVGQVDYEWYFDEDEYNEWLQDNELVDSEEVRMQYYKEEVTYGVEYYDNETYHYMDGDQNLLFDDLVDLFGERMANEMLSNCIKDGKGKFETYEIYADNEYDINNPQELNDIAMKLFSHGEYYKDCRGFILSNGVIVYTPSEHNEICMIPGVSNKFDFIRLGNIRILPNSIDIGAEPTGEQEEVLRHVIASYSDEELYLDIFTNGGEIGAKYVNPNWRYVMGEIDRYYREGIKPQGSYGLYESKINESDKSFNSWFGNSVLRDDNGNPLKMYHGTDADFNSFSKDFIGKTGSYEGYGFNFTPFESRARGYNPKNVIEAYLKVERPMTTKSNNISLNDLIKIIEKLDEGKPYTDTIVAAYEPSKYGEKWDEKYYRRALPVAARTIYQYNLENEYGDAGIYAEICLNGNADKFKTIEVFEKLGYDSAIFYDDDGRINTVVVFEPTQIKRTSNKTFTADSEVMDENLESEVEASEVSLDSFKKQETLEPKLWDKKTLKSRVRLKLLDIADDFWEFAGISWVKRRGIHLTGSICNYNWSKFSDIDLHLVVDFTEVDERTDFVQEYFDSKKNEWNETHDKLKIYGYPVELYVEDVNAETASGGVYDLEKNEWINEPQKESYASIGLEKYEIKNKSAKFMTKIDDLLDLFEKTDDDAKLREIGKTAHKLYNKIKRLRKFGLKRGGESDPYNIVFKVLRRTGYLEKLWNLNAELYDKVNSLCLNESVDANNIDIFSLAKERFGTTYDIRECGFILPDGSMLDFSGRHMITGNTDSSHLRGQRGIDHREIYTIGWDENEENKNFDITMEDFIRSGAIRIHFSSSWSSINLFERPTKEQENVLLRLIRMSKGNVTVEIGDGNESLSYAEYDDANPRRVVNDIIRYFTDGIRLIGNVSENKIIDYYYNKFIGINEEVVADGNASHNPFKQRWKHERQVLKNYICNYGTIMTSKENGKQYKVLYDQMLSQRLGINYCICIQWNPQTMEPGEVIYVRAFDKFTTKIFRPQFDTRGFDNIGGTADDIATA